MVRRRPAAVIGALCVALAMAGGPAASAEVVGPGVRPVVTDLPVLSELPPLPTAGQPPEAEDEGDGEAVGVEGNERRCFLSFW